MHFPCIVKGEQEGEEMDECYNAFISYRHAPLDSRIAQEVQRRLEQYPVPKAVARRTGIRRINRVFRDKEELPITSDLNDNIERALLHSEFLIVICSPRTRESAWVQKEIETFLQTHSRKNVLTVLAEGEPADVIPEILLKNELVDAKTGEVCAVPMEPLSCDYRLPLRRARSEELPRLVAAILGCGYDELRQRQKLRRARNLTAAMSGVLVLVTAFLVYALNRSITISRQAELIASQNADLEEQAEQILAQNDQLTAAYNDTLRRQSQYLASESRQILNNQWDIETAVLLALEALPGEGNERLWTPEAELALGQALDIYANGGMKYYPIQKKFYGSDTIKEFWIDDQWRYITLWDNSGFLTTWEIESSECLWSEYVGDSWRAKVNYSANGRILVYGDGLLTCYGAANGEVLWQIEPSASVKELQVIEETGQILANQGSQTVASYCLDSGELLWTLKIEGLPESSLDFINIPYGQDTDRYTFLSAGEYFSEEPDSLIVLNFEEANDSLIQTTLREIELVSRLDSGELIIMGRENGDFEYRAKERVIQILCYDPERDSIRWTNELAVYRLFGDDSLWCSACDEDRLFLTVGGTCATFDLQSGELCSQVQLESGIIGVTVDHGDKEATLAETNGNLVSYSFETGEALETEIFSYLVSLKSMRQRQDTGEYFLLPENSECVLLCSKAQRDENFVSMDTEHISTIMGTQFADHYLLVADFNYFLRLFDLNSGEAVWCMTPEYEGETLRFSAMELSEDCAKTYVYSSIRQVVLVIDNASGETEIFPVKELAGEYFGESIYWSGDAQVLTNRGFYFLHEKQDGGNNAQLLLMHCDLESGEISEKCCLGSYPAGGSGALANGTLERVGDRLLIGSDPCGTWLVDAEGVSSVSLPSEIGEEAMYAWDPNNSLCAITWEREVMLVDRKGTVTGKTELKYAAASMTFSPDGQTLLLVDNNHFLRRYSLDGSLLSSTMLGDARFFRSFENARWIFPDNGEIIIATANGISIVEPKEYKLQTTSFSTCYGYYRGKILSNVFRGDGSEIGYYRRYTLEQLVEMGRERVKGLTIRNPEQYGLA